MSFSVNLLHQFEGTHDVAILVSFVTAAEQHDNRVAALDEIHPVARTVIDPHLRHAATHRLHIAGIAKRKAADAHGDSGARLAIPQTCKPIRKHVGLPDLHQRTVSYKGQSVKISRPLAVVLP
jgi:hypothetical protein